MSSRHLSRPTLEELEGRTVPSASLVADVNPGGNVSVPRYFTNVNGTVFFQANDGTNGTELWKSDGTPGGTVLVKNIRTGSDSSFPSQLTNVNGTLFFNATDDVNGVGLWKSDGTATGTVLVKDIHLGIGSSNLSELTNVNGTLFFSATDSVNGAGLWKSDGTTAGTILVKVINPGSVSSNPRYLTNVNGTLFFRSSDGNGSELWKSDGTTAGTTLVKDICTTGSYNSYPSELTNVNGTLFFSATDGVNGGFELWKSDGTAAGTILVKDINPGGYASLPTHLTNVNGTLFFSATDGVNSGYELWKSDGTATGTILVKDINPGSTYSNPVSLTNVNGTLFFTATDANGAELWKSDGTSAGTTLVKDINPGSDRSFPKQLTNVNGTLFFTATDGVNGYELWTSDGTATGTTLVQDILPGSASSSPYYFATANGTLFFSAGDGTHGQELWSATAQSNPTDTAGAKVTAAVFSGTVPDTFDKVRITFSEAINPATFTAADIGSFVEPGGGNAITVTAVTPVAGTQKQFDVTFPAQTTLGKYSFTTSVEILDLAGNQMNQDGDASNGEDGQDHFTASATLVAVPPFFAVGNFGGEVRIVNSSTGAVISTIRPLDNGGTKYTGLVEVALGDFNGDTIPDLAVSAADPSGVRGLAATKAGKVFVFDGAALATGTVPSSSFRTFTPFATTDGPAGKSGAFVNGLNIATGDVNEDGTVDLIAGTRGGNGTTSGLNEYGRLVVIDGTSAAGSNTVIGGIQKPFGSGYQKGVVVAAGDADGVVGDEIAVTRGGPVASTNPAVQRIKVKVLKLQGTTLNEVHLSADGSTSFAPFGSVSGTANAIKRDGRVAFVDTNGDGKDELVFSALDPLTNPANGQVRVGVFSINVVAATGAATIVSTGPDAGTYVTGKAVVDHAITHVPATGAQQNLALITESESSGIVYLAPLTGVVQLGGFGLTVLNGGIVFDGI